MIADETTKVCIRCGKPKPRSEFQRRSCSADGRESRCRECLNKRRQEMRPTKGHGVRPVAIPPVTVVAEVRDGKCPKCGSRALFRGGEGFRSCLMCGTTV